MFILESPHRCDSYEYTQYTIFQYEKEKHPKLSQIGSYEIFSKGLKNEFERAMINEPSVFEPLKFYCILTHKLWSILSDWCSLLDQIHKCIIISMSILHLHAKLGYKKIFLFLIENCCFQNVSYHIPICAQKIRRPIFFIFIIIIIFLKVSNLYCFTIWGRASLK